MIRRFLDLVLKINERKVDRLIGSQTKIKICSLLFSLTLELQIQCLYHRKWKKNILQNVNRCILHLLTRRGFLDNIELCAMVVCVLLKLPKLDAGEWLITFHRQHIQLKVCDERVYVKESV